MNGINPIPLEIKSPTRIYKGLYVIDFGVVIIFWTFMSSFESFINPILNIPYGIFNVLVAFYLVRPSKSNLGRRKYLSLLYSLTKDKRVYHTDFSFNSISKKDKNTDNRKFA